MSKQTPFFKFDAMQWLGGAIQNCTLEEKGLFIDLCALYWKDYKPVKMDAKFKVRYRNLEGTLNSIVGTLSDLDFIVVSEAEITIPFLDALMGERAEFLKKCSKAGKKSASIKGTSSNKKEERRKKSVDIRKKIEDKETENIYRKFAHLKLSVKEYDAMIADGYSKAQIDEILDDIENYKKNTNYKSLNLTARKWINKRREDEQPKVDDRGDRYYGL